MNSKNRIQLGVHNDFSQSTDEFQQLHYCTDLQALIWIDKLSQMPWSTGSYEPTKEIQACLNKSAIVSNYNFQHQNLYNLSFVTSCGLHSWADHESYTFFFITSARVWTSNFSVNLFPTLEAPFNCWYLIASNTVSDNTILSLAFESDRGQPGFPAIRKTVHCPHSNPTHILIFCINEVLNGTFDGTSLNLAGSNSF